MGKIINELETAIAHIIIGMIYTAPLVIGAKMATFIFRVVNVLVEVLG